MNLPPIIQGSPDVALSTWSLARAVAQAGQLGVVSSAALAAVLARRLQLGDFDGHQREALEHFPFPGVARRVWEQFFVPGGRAANQPFELVRQPMLDQGPALVELTVLANFTEVFLAKAGHAGSVGLHLHDQVPIPLMPSVYGALLADVDYLLVGGRSPWAVPAVLDRLVQGQAARLKVEVEGAPADAAVACGFDPAAFAGTALPAVRRPRILVFVASPEQAAAWFLRAGGQVNGFIWELGASQLPTPTAAEHMRSLGLPFWLGGRSAEPGSLATAQALGAAGMRVSTPFTFCAESALDAALKSKVITQGRSQPGTLAEKFVPTPTGLPMSVLRLDGTAADTEVFAARDRLCDVGYFRQTYQKPNGSVGYRCPGEPVGHYGEKGGSTAVAERQICLCNSLLASVGLGQIRPGAELERALVPAGESLGNLGQFLSPGRDAFTAGDVIRRLLG